MKTYIAMSIDILLSIFAGIVAAFCSFMFVFQYGDWLGFEWFLLPTIIVVSSVCYFIVTTKMIRLSPGMRLMKVKRKGK